jgi:hypothetical protein
MFRPRKEPDPLRGKRQHLAERERLLAEQMSQLNEKIARGGEDAPQPQEPPVWRLEDDVPAAPHRNEPTGAGKRVLKRQRRNDKILFFALIVALAIVIFLFILALGHSHTSGNLPGS